MWSMCSTGNQASICNETSTCVLLLADEHSVDIGRTHLIGNGLKNVPITGFDYH